MTQDIIQAVPPRRNVWWHFSLFHLNWLWPGDTIWRQRSGSTLAQVMAWAWGQQAITWTNVDLSSVKSWGIHLRDILRETLKVSILDVSLKITNLRRQTHLPEDMLHTGTMEFDLLTERHLRYFLEYYMKTVQNNITSLYKNSTEPYDPDSFKIWVYGPLDEIALSNQTIIYYYATSGFRC